MGAKTSRNATASSALAATAVISAAFLSVVDVPEQWLRALVSRPPAPPRGTIEHIWLSAAAFLPFGELGHRLDMLATIWVLACALAATWAGHQLFRGPGRWWAAVAAGPITALALTHWHHEVGPAIALGQLPATFTAMLAVTEVVRALVHFGFVPILARSRAIAAAALTALLLPRAGIPLLGLLAAGSMITRRSPPPDPDRPIRSRIVPISVAVLPYATAAVVLTAMGMRWQLPSISSLSLVWPTPETLGGHLPALGFYLGVAMLVVLAAPLRWRGGPLLVGLGLSAIAVHDTKGPLAPIPATLALLCVATCGWIWVAGTMSRARGRWLAMASTPLAVGAVAAPLLGAMLPVVPAAQRRPQVAILDVYEKGLIAPGDAVLVFGSWLPELEEARHIAGFRPDVQVQPADELDMVDRARQAFEWQGQQRRILSDSFDAGGSWSPDGVVDSGPLFWFVGPRAAADVAFTELRRFHPPLSEMPARDQATLAVLLVERARFRRAIDAPDAALEALPLSPERREGLITRLQLARSVKAAPSRGSEMEAPRNLDEIDAAAWVTAEAADLMYAHGEYGRAAELFVEASQEGYPESLAALARWQLRAGEELSAIETLELLATEPTLRRSAVHILWWLCDQDRIEQGAELAEGLAETTPSQPEATYDEVAARLRLTNRMAQRPAGFEPGPATTPAVAELGGPPDRSQ